MVRGDEGAEPLHAGARGPVDEVLLDLQQGVQRELEQLEGRGRHETRRTSVIQWDSAEWDSSGRATTPPPTFCWSGSSSGFFTTTSSSSSSSPAAAMTGGGATPCAYFLVISTKSSRPTWELAAGTHGTVRRNLKHTHTHTQHQMIK